ncbi:MAG: alpha/beta hydrolase [Gloeobacterales cyanobacterium]
MNHCQIITHHLRFHVVEAGFEGPNQTDKPLVLLLHGFPECWYAWRHQIPLLAEYFRVVAPDLRGYNLSEKPTEVSAYRLNYLVEDVLALADYYGAEQFYLVGHDWGAMIAWATALLHPERVVKLAALQVPHPQCWLEHMRGAQLQASWYITAFQVPILPELMISLDNYCFVEQAFLHTSTKRGTISKADIQVFKEACAQPGALTAGINYYRANLGLDNPLQQFQDPVKVPTLFIYGEKDFAILPETVKDLKKYVDSPYEEVRLPDCGHWVQQEAPETVNQVLIAFLRKRSNLS